MAGIFSSCSLTHSAHKHYFMLVLMELHATFMLDFPLTDTASHAANLPLQQTNLKVSLISTSPIIFHTVLKLQCFCCAKDMLDMLLQFIRIHSVSIFLLLSNPRLTL